MKMLEEMLRERNLPAVFTGEQTWETRRVELLEMLCREEYGFLPPLPQSMQFEILETNERYCAGKATYQKIRLQMTFPTGEFAFPFYAVIPNKPGKHPFFVHINFRDNVPDRYMPTEEICDNGFAVFSFCYRDVTSDDGDFSTGLAGVLACDPAKDCGKIALWAYAASRVMDYAQTLSCLDFTRAAVAGHSRLGKTALLAGALDTRFTAAFSNESGCSGAALSRGGNEKRETVGHICGQFPFWFCRRYQQYAGAEDTLPFDQHFLLACMAPRRVYVASAAADLWADPVSEYLSCVAAGKVYRQLGLSGFVCPDRLPQVGDVFAAGRIGYHLRAGTHYFSRADWLHFVEFLKI